MAPLFRKSNRLIKFAVLVFASAAAASCSRSGDSLPKDQPLRIQLGAEPVSLDPARVEDGAALRVVANTMDGLVGYDGNGKLVDRLAESHTISADGKRLEFTLRKDIRWSDGLPISSEDFVQGLRRALHRDSGSKLGSLLFPIRNAKAYHAGKAEAATLGLRAEPGKLVIELEMPAPYFVHALTLPPALPAREDILRNNGGTWPYAAPVTGAYRITEHIPDQRISFERNPHYYREHSGPARVEILVVADESTAMHLFEQGKLDIVNKVPLTELPRLRKKGVLRSFPFLATYYVAFNTAAPPFNRKAVRQAVARAINKEEIVAALASGDTVAHSWLPPGLEGHSSDEAPWKTPAEPVIKTSAPVPAGFDGSARNSLIMEKIQQDVLRKTGLRLALSNMDWKSYVKKLQSDPPALFRFGWQAPFMDPLPHLLAFTSDDPNNYTRWKNGKYDALIARIRALPSGSEREALIREADLILTHEDVVVIPIYHYVQNYAVSERVKTCPVNPFGVLRFDEVLHP